MRNLRVLFFFVSYAFLNLNSISGQFLRVNDFKYENSQFLFLKNQTALFARNKIFQIDNYPANVNRLNLSQDVIFDDCDIKEARCSENTEKIDIWTEASDPQNDVLTYNYTVSGGKIIGKGAKVIWDLSDVKSGTYKITAGVDDGCGVCGVTRTREVQVVECPKLSDKGYPSGIISNLQLDRTQVFSSCYSKKRNNSCSNVNNLVKVSAILPGTSNFKPIYKYEVTSGQIIGNGADVEWDLSRVKAGTYFIAASVDVGQGFCGNSTGRMVTVVECPKCK